MSNSPQGPCGAWEQGVALPQSCKGQGHLQVTEGTQDAHCLPAWAGCCSLSSAPKETQLGQEAGPPPQTSSLSRGHLLSSTCFPVLFTVDDAASLSFSLFLRFLSLCPLPCPYLPPARVDQTQTQLEHARIGELEQSLLLEKAQAERLLRELADNRVTRPPPPAPGAPARGTRLLCVIISSVLHCCPRFFLLRPF